MNNSPPPDDILEGEVLEHQPTTSTSAQPNNGARSFWQERVKIFSGCLTLIVVITLTVIFGGLILLVLVPLVMIGYLVRKFGAGKK